MNIRVELIERIEHKTHNDFAYGDQDIPTDLWYDIETTYEPTGKYGTLIQVTRGDGYRRAQAVILMDSGEFVEVEGLDTIRAITEVAK
ncbi:hypothetical protein RI53_09640 [Listeria monocytogenes]|nr:hypothetical protein [Listeria monocytogenes]